MTKLSIDISIEDYLKMKNVYAKFISKVQPLGKILDGETRQLIEEMNEIYTNIESMLQEEIIMPECFTQSCLLGNCTSDINICRYVEELINEPRCIRVHKDSLSKFEKLGWELISKDVRKEDGMFADSNFVVLKPVS